MSDKSKICTRLRASRKAAGYASSYVFAQQFNIPKSTYSQHESGSRVPKDNALEEYAGYLGVNLMWLKTGRGLPFPAKDERNNKVREIAKNTETSIDWAEQFKEKPFVFNKILLTVILSELFSYAEKHNMIISYPEISDIAVSLYETLCKHINDLSPTHEMVISGIETYFHVSQRN